MSIIENKNNYLVFYGTQGIRDENGIITFQNGNVLVSYKTRVAFEDAKCGKYLDKKFHNYSNTTIRHINQFLGIDRKEKKKQLENGQLKLVDLQVPIPIKL